MTTAEQLHFDFLKESEIEEDLRNKCRFILGSHKWCVMKYRGDLKFGDEVVFDKDGYMQKYENLRKRYPNTIFPRLGWVKCVHKDRTASVVVL